MKKDTKFPPRSKGQPQTIKRVQKSFAFRKGTSSMGSKYKKGDVIVHFSSARSTGESFSLTEGDLQKLVDAKPGRWWSRVRWLEQLHRAWITEHGSKALQVNSG